MTEEIAATPGWVDSRLEEAFAPLGQHPDLAAARDRYATCLGRAKAPAAPSDTLGSEFEQCRTALMGELSGLGVDKNARDALTERLEAVEAELAGES